ncbi:hypothetical protein GN958_ATG02399 [Phytophthora infestans]|uniref:Uncharacterized protein n=1 Tax=Phytophthora infestans TaxID=4787 RepID=A0A8S9VAH8_PHYIN|nr:hypothetical protein GN958_ATG02399 [Phytophthora infestans]
MKNIGEDCRNGRASGDTRDIKPLAYQQGTPRSAASVQSEKPSQTTAWRPPALVSTHVGFEELGEVRWSGAWTFGIVLRRIEMSATSCPSG